LSRSELSLVQALILGEFDFRFEPILRLAVRADYMNVAPGLFT